MSDLRDQYPPNSHKSKEKKQITKVTKGKVVQQKKPLGKKFAESFLGEDSKSVGAYIITEVLLPALKDTIVDMVSGGIEMLMHGKRTGRPSRGSKSGYVSYGGYYKDKERSKNREPSYNQRRKSFEDIVLETRGEAEEVLENLVDLTVDYDVATVADLYDLVGITGSFTDEKYCWFELGDSGVTRVRGGYLLNLPNPEPIG